MVLLCIASGNAVCQTCMDQFCKGPSSSLQFAGGAALTGGAALPLGTQTAFGSWDGAWTTTLGAFTLRQVSDADWRAAAGPIGAPNCSFVSPVLYRGDLNWPTLRQSFGSASPWQGTAAIVACGDALGQQLHARFADQAAQRGSLVLIRHEDGFTGQVNVDAAGGARVRVAGQKR